MDMVIMAAIFITAIMATLAAMDIQVWMTTNVVRATISLMGLVDVLNIMTPMAGLM